MTASERNHRQPGCTCERMAPHVWDAAGCEMHRYGVQEEAQDDAIIADLQKIKDANLEPAQKLGRQCETIINHYLKSMGIAATVDSGKYVAALRAVVEAKTLREAQEIARAALGDA